DFVRVTGSLNALHQHRATGKQLPVMSWDFANGGERLELRMGADIPVSKASAWVATSPTRDFRRASWKSFACRKEGAEHCYELEIPREGYAALFGEAVFTDNGPLPYFLSTNVQIVNRPRN